MLPYIDRPVFFERQNLGAEDLQSIVNYAYDRSRRHALGSHTWGIVHGLQLIEQEEAGGTIAVHLSPGLAVDGYGRSIVVENPLRLAEESFADQAASLVPVWIGYEETPLQDLRQGQGVCCGDGSDQVRRAQEGFAVKLGKLSAASQRHDGVLLDTVELEDPRLILQQLDEDLPLLCDGSIPHQQLDEQSPIRRWWIPVGQVGWQPGAPGQFRALSDAEKIGSRQLRWHAALVTEDLLAAEGMLRMRYRETLRSATGSVDDDCIAGRLSSNDLLMVDGRPEPSDLLSIEGDTRALGQVKLFGTRLEFRESNGDDVGVPLYLRRQAVAGGHRIEVVLGESGTADNKLSVGTAADHEAMDTQLVMQSDGLVGLGTETPGDYADNANHLVVADAVSGGMTIASAATGQGALHFADGTSEDTQARGFMRYEHDSDALVLGSSGEARVTVNVQGRVGIGTSEPSSGMHIVNGQSASLGSDSGYLLIGETDSINLVFDGNEIQARNNSSGSTLFLNARGGDILFHSNQDLQQRVKINDAGRLAIGVDAPQSPLHVRGSDPVLTLDLSTDTSLDRAEVHFADNGAVMAGIEWRRSDGRSYWRNTGSLPVTLSGSDVGIGLGTGIQPTSRLHVRDGIDGNANELSSHVALLENSSTGTSADVLALRVAAASADTGNNFITFFDSSGARGAIQGSAGGVSLITGGADFAEVMPQLIDELPIRAGEVVGVFAGTLSRVTDGADAVMVATTCPAVLGNAELHDPDASLVGVSFIGQVPVRVSGTVRAGDLLLASGLNDGRAIAIDPQQAGPEHLERLIGRAWTATDDSDGEVTVAVGIAGSGALESLIRCWSQERDRVDQLQQKLDTLSAQLQHCVDTLARYREAFDGTDQTD